MAARLHHARRFALRVASVVITVVLASGCGQNDATPNTSGTTVGEEPAATEESTEQPIDDQTADETADEAPSPGGVVDTSGGPDINLFFDGALANDITTEDCTLADGTASTCYRITVVGAPADHEIGPFCPTTTDATAEDAGIWFDGSGLYDLDGDFILGLAELYNDSNWLLHDGAGNVHVTDTPEAFAGAARPNVDPAYQNHCVEGRIEWLAGGQPIPTTVLIPTMPIDADSVGFGGRSLGVTLNGVTIDGAAPVGAILGAYTIAAFDDCGGHINPVAGYHLHGAVGCGEVAIEGHAGLFGYALDGYGIHSPYDEDGEPAANLDECGGHTAEGLGYHYHASPAAENAVISCFTGLLAQ